MSDAVDRELARARRWPRQLSPHREGIWLILMVLGMGVAAINTGHNLLYLILGFLLSIILVSGFLSEYVLSRADLEIEPPEGLHAGDLGRATATVHNRGKKGRIYSVRASPLLDPDDAECAPAYAAEILPGAAALRPLRILFKRRGIFRVEHARLQTDFPFTLFTKGRVIPLRATFRIWPRLHPVRVSPPSASRQEQSATNARIGATGEDFFGVREYRPGDPTHRIHWRLTARAGRPLVRELELPQNPSIVVHCRIPSLANPLAEDVYAETAASVAVAALDAGYAVGLRTPRVELLPDRGVGQRRRILDALAEEPPAGERGAVAVVAVDGSGRALPTSVPIKPLSRPASPTAEAA
jgi:uncharacterized protein (DUF58 family)